MESVNQFLFHWADFLSGIVWGVPFLVLLVGTGVLLTFLLRFVQVRKLGHAFRVISGKYDDPRDAGDVNHFQALSAALSATIGIGNIAGVATAIHFGGPGALFWMWVTAFFGMATKGVECYLAHRFRVVHEDGTVSGGPMYYIVHGLGPKFRWLGIAFAFLAAVASLGSADMVQANTVAQVFHVDLHIPTWVTGLVMSSLVALVIVGGIRRIAHVASGLVPAMCGVYLIAGLTVLLLHLDQVGSAFVTIVSQAFTPAGATGGFVGSTFLATLTWGMKRGLFSNEAGQGSAPIAHAAARTRFSVREGVVAMAGPFIDTIVVCTVTGLVIVVTDAWRLAVDPATGHLLNGAAMTAWAFETGLSPLFTGGHYVVTIAVPLFAFSTAIAWSYYGDRCTEFLFGARAVPIYRIVFVCFHFIGSVFALKLVWTMADVSNGLMAAPNLIALIGLAGLAQREWKAYFAPDGDWKVRA